MSALDRTPINTNFLLPDGFIIVIKRCPTVKFFTQQINVPGISASVPEHPTPLIHIPQTPDHMQFDDLSFTFKVDEDLRNYMEIFNWINGLTYPEDHSEYKELADKEQFTGDGLKSDISLLITTNIKNPNIEINYLDCFPIALSGFTMSTTEDSVQEITTSATFKFTKYDIKTLPK